MQQRSKGDSKQYFRNPNAAKYPDYPTASVLRTVIEADPEFDAASTNLFACRNTLGNLLRFAHGIDKAFHFNAKVISKTLFSIRKENNSKEVIKDIRGFSNTFPKAYIAWEHGAHSTALKAAKLTNASYDMNSEALIVLDASRAIAISERLQQSMILRLQKLL
jgi:hypothetical protein